MTGPLLPDHVRVDLDGDRSEAWRGCADVLYGTGSPRAAVALLRRYPGCLLVSLRDGRGRCVTLVREITADGDGNRIGVLEVRTGVLGARGHALLASLLYGRLVAGGGGPAGPWTVVLRQVRCPAAARPGAGRPVG